MLFRKGMVWRLDGCMTKIGIEVNLNMETGHTCTTSTSVIGTGNGTSSGG